VSSVIHGSSKICRDSPEVSRIASSRGEGLGCPLQPLANSWLGVRGSRWWRRRLLFMLAKAGDGGDEEEERAIMTRRHAERQYYVVSRTKVWFQSFLYSFYLGRAARTYYYPPARPSAPSYYSSPEGGSASPRSINSRSPSYSRPSYRSLLTQLPIFHFSLIASRSSRSSDLGASNSLMSIVAAAAVLGPYIIRHRREKWKDRERTLDGLPT
jgi:hypothetical protein